MQKTVNDGVVICCDFCHTEWDGQSGMVEGHHGSAICLNCLDRALREKNRAEGKYACTLCLRVNMPASLDRWSHPDRPEVRVCQECLYQAAKAMSRAPHVDWQWKGPGG